MNLDWSKMQAKLRSPLRDSTKVDGYSMVELVVTIILLSVAIPAIASMYATTFAHSQTAEIITTAELLAIEQMEIILAHKAGSGGGFGYSSITAGRYSSVNPSAPFSAFTRTVNVQTVDTGAQYEYKRITVTVDHGLTSPIVLTTIVMDHSALP